MSDGKPTLHSVRDVTPRLEYRTIHGYRRAYRIAGSGPAILLIHGIGDNSTTWETVQTRLAQRFTVIAPDLLGHGQSDKPRAVYSFEHGDGAAVDGHEGSKKRNKARSFAPGLNAV